MTTTLYVCETCGFRADDDSEAAGAQFAAAIERRLEREPLADLTLRRTRCLMACKRHCTVHLRAPGKINYVIGDFRPSAADAATLLDYVRHYQQSDTGQVPYKLWPEGIKGHFVARTPPHETENETTHPSP